MEWNHLLQQLQQQDSSILLDLLERAYEQMNTNQRRTVFGQFAKRLLPTVVDPQSLLADLQTFQQESLDGRYYAPFEINSKNFMDIPEETEAWFERLNDLLQSSALLTKQEDHEGAIACFKILFDLIEQIDSGEEIVFADELGSWMIPGNETAYAAAYLTSLAAASTPAEFSEHVTPLLKRDSWQSFSNQIYVTVLKIATPEQIKHVEAEIEQKKIRIPPPPTSPKPSSRSKKATSTKQAKSQPTSRTQTKRKH